MKIMYIPPLFLGDKLAGSEYVLYSLAKYAAAGSHEVSFVTSNSTQAISFFNPFKHSYLPVGENKCRGFTTIRLRTDWFTASSKYLYWKIFQQIMSPYQRDKAFIRSRGPILAGLENAIRDWQPDIIHTSPFPLSNTEQAIRLANKCSVPVILTPFVHIELGAYKNVYSFNLCNQADCVTACTKSEKDFLIKNRVKESKIEIIPLGIETSEYKNLPKNNLRDRFNIPINNKIILYAGTYNDDKGFYHTLEAVHKLSRIRHDFTLITIGGSKIDYLHKDEMERMGILNNIGYADEVLKKQLFAQADFFVMPSRAESFGLVYLEAWINKRPVIGSASGAVKDIITSGKDGLLVTYGDTESLASAIQTLLNSANKRNSFGSAGYDKVINKFTWEKQAPKFIELYETIS